LSFAVGPRSLADRHPLAGATNTNEKAPDKRVRDGGLIQARAGESMAAGAIKALSP